MVPESWVAALAFVLMVRDEQVLRADDARVHADVLGPPVVASEGSLVSHALRHEVLKRSELFPESISSLLETPGPPSFESLERGPTSILALQLFGVLSLLEFEDLAFTIFF